jgi:monoterpene epsilon-lactone hydrolase
VLDPEIQPIVDLMEAAEGPPAHLVPIAQARAAHDKETAVMSGPGEDVAEVRDVEAPGPGGPIPVRLFRPLHDRAAGGAPASDGSARGAPASDASAGGAPASDASACGAPASDASAGGALPLVAYLHGGGWVLGTLDAFDPVCRALANASGALVASIGYRLAPEHPFPAAPDDCFAAWNWMLSAGFDPARVVFAGDSAGGNLALVTAMRARDEGLPLPAALVLMSPVLDLTFSGASFARNDGIDPMFRAETASRIGDWYAPGLDHADPHISPLFGSAADLPPTQLHVGSSEILLDDSLRYAAQAPGTLVAVWHGMPHVFPAIRGLVDGDRAIAEMADFIREHTADATRGTN